MSDDKFPYEIRFDFTTDKQEDLLEKVWPVTLAKRIIKAEFGLEPFVENSASDVRYRTDDAVLFIELMKLLYQHSAGGWWVAEPMPEGQGVFHFPSRGNKYSNG